MSDKHPDLLIYEQYPRRVARLGALKAIAKAVLHITKADEITPLEARRKLYRITKMYANSPAGQNPDKSKIPHPATWFNRGSYLDDPSEWQHNGDFNGNRQSYIPPSVVRASVTGSALQRAIQRHEQNAGTDQDIRGGFALGDSTENDG